MRKSYRYDKASKTVLPLDEWLKRNQEPVSQSHHVIPDIKPYKAVTGDMEGKWITSRREHREFLKRNNLIECGGEKAYMTRWGGMTPDNPNVQPEWKHEERICQSLVKNLERLRSR